MSGQAVGHVGEVLSYQRGKDEFDWAVTDTSVVLSGFVIPDHYSGEPWKIHTVSPYDYYDDPLKTDLERKSLRTTAPIGGKIDFDIDGRLAGNWFLDGTRDYMGSGLAEAGESSWTKILGMDPGDCKAPLWDNKSQRDLGYRPCAYWLGHAVFAYDHLAPDRILVSLGIHYDEYGGIHTPLMVLNNGPDPAEVDINTGQVKYEVLRGNVTRGMLHREETLPEKDSVEGTLLIEMLDTRSIKVELFIGTTADGVSDFTEKAKIYRR